MKEGDPQAHHQRSGRKPSQDPRPQAKESFVPLWALLKDQWIDFGAIWRTTVSCPGTRALHDKRSVTVGLGVREESNPQVSVL